MHGAAEAEAAEAAEASASTPLPPPPPGTPPAKASPPAKAPPSAKSQRTPKSKTSAKPPSKDGIADDVKDIGVGFAKDMLTTADGRRTLRTVFGALFGKK